MSTQRFLLIKVVLLALLESVASFSNKNIVILLHKDRYPLDKTVKSAIDHSVAYVNTNILRNTGTLSVDKVIVRNTGVFDNDFLYGANNKRLLETADIFLLPHHIHQMCLLGEMLQVPTVALNYIPNLMCENVFSMRPDPLLMTQAVVAMLRESSPSFETVVAVVTEDGFGDFATAIMSYEQQRNQFSFQILTTVNFTEDDSMSRTIKELKECGSRKILLIMQQENAYKLMVKVRSSNFEYLHAYQWFTAVLETDETSKLKTFEDFMSLSMPVDDEAVNKTVKELHRMSIIPNPDTNVINPLIHDALSAIAYAFKASSESKQCIELHEAPKEFCPVRRPRCNPLSAHLSKVIFRGMTGDVKFTKSKYRNITIMDANEVRRGVQQKLGTWSVPCEAFKWNPETTLAKRHESMTRCKKIQENNIAVSYQPRRRHLRVVAKVEQPFLFHDPTMKTENPNDKFSGFCKDILDKLAEDLQFKYDLYLVPDEQYGDKRLNGSWNGMVGELINKEADIAIGALTMTSEREGVIDFSKSFMDFTMAILLKKKPLHYIGYFQFLRPFTLGTWISIVGATVAVAFIMFIIERFSPMGYRKLASRSADYNGNEFSLANSFWFATASLLQQGPDQTPKSIAGRILSTSFWFFVSVIMAAYIAGMAGYLMTAKPDERFNTLEDIMSSRDIKYGTLRGGQTAKLLQTSKYHLHRKMHKKITTMGTFKLSIKSAIDKVRTGEMAFIGDQPLLEYAHTRQPCDTSIIKHVLEMQSYAFGLQLSSEWTNSISVHLLHLRETGFMQSLRMKWWEEQTECNEAKQPIRSPLPLGFNNMAGICAVLAVGIFLSLLLLLFEIKCRDLMKASCMKGTNLPRKEQQMIKAPQITYLDYKANSDHYDVAFSKMYGSKYEENSKLTHSYEESQKMYKDAPESTL